MKICLQISRRSCCLGLIQAKNKSKISLCMPVYLNGVGRGEGDLQYKKWALHLARAHIYIMRLPVDRAEWGVLAESPVLLTSVSASVRSQQGRMYRDQRRQEGSRGGGGGGSMVKGWQLGRSNLGIGVRVGWEGVREGVSVRRRNLWRRGDSREGI
jgi:hypothetical protein